MTHFKNSDRTLAEHDTKVIWNRIDAGGPVAFKSAAQNMPRLLPRGVSLHQSQHARVDTAQASVPHHTQ